MKFSQLNDEQQANATALHDAENERYDAEQARGFCHQPQYCPIAVVNGELCRVNRQAYVHGHTEVDYIEFGA